jgi:transposase InsO family protein
MKFKMVEELSLEQQDVARVCEVLLVSRSGYYEWLDRPQSDRRNEDERLWQKIKKHWETSRKTYGRLRLTKKLQEEGEKVGKNRVAKIMKSHQIQGVGKRKFKPITTTSNHDFPVAERVFETERAPEQVTRPNQFWGGDITYIPTEEGWLYLAVFLDLFTRKAVGHSMQETMHAELVTRAIDLALKRQGLLDAKELVAHSDRGSQYASQDYRKKLAAHKITASMSRKGNCYDNAFVESFFRTLKVELIYTRKFKTREEARAAIFEFIEVWYNRQRIHSSIDYMTPEQYETKHLSAA